MICRFVGAELGLRALVFGLKDMSLLQGLRNVDLLQKLLVADVLGSFAASIALSLG